MTAGRPNKYGAKLRQLSLSIPEPLFRTIEDEAYLSKKTRNEYVINLMEDWFNDRRKTEEV